MYTYTRTHAHTRAHTRILVAANTRAGGVASMGVRAGAKAAIALVCAR
eukprot:COSAG05_NODE_26069_length_191_cov_24.858696_1_plen_47_part_10